MKRVVDRAIVLRRLNYGDSDRIVTLLTKDNGKLTVFAKGVRKQKSRLSGGIELLCISEVSFMQTRGDLYSLVGANMLLSYDQIVKDMERLNIVYEALRLLDKLCEDGYGQEYFGETELLLDYIQRPGYDPMIVKSWYDLKLMKKTGVLGDLQVIKGEHDDVYYHYDSASDKFLPAENGEYSQQDIKLINVLHQASKPVIFSGVVNSLKIKNLITQQLNFRLS